jgi:uncharacterized membrane protein YkoI
MRRIKNSVAALAVLIGDPAFAAPDEKACYPDWSVAAPIVKREGLIPVEQLTPLARFSLNGEILKVTLCFEAGNYVFRLVVRGAKGDLKTVTVDAKDPF